MVYYFTSRAVDQPASIYVGKDKFENEELIKFGIERDVWFHADNLSSAHVYLRMRDGEAWDTVPEPLLEECAQLTKANSIEGNKKDNVTIVYTPWSNLYKNAGMAAGQVSFHNPRLVRKLHVPTRLNPTINRLNKTRVEKFPDLRAEKEEHLANVRCGERKKREAHREAERQQRKEYEELKWQKDHAYDDMFTEENVEMSNNQDRDENFLDDFM